MKIWTYLMLKNRKLDFFVSSSLGDVFLSVS